MVIDIKYHSSAAIIIIVLNAISFLSLAFVLSVYIIRWKKITSFPLRLVILFSMLVFLPLCCLYCSEPLRADVQSRSGQWHREQIRYSEWGFLRVRGHPESLLWPVFDYLDHSDHLRQLCLYRVEKELVAGWSFLPDIWLFVLHHSRYSVILVLKKACFFQNVWIQHLLLLVQRDQS